MDVEEEIRPRKQGYFVWFEIPHSISICFIDPDRSQHSVDHIKFDEVPDEKVRILQDNLVFVNGLPSEASSKEVTPYRPRLCSVQNTSFDTELSPNSS